MTTTWTISIDWNRDGFLRKPGKPDDVVGYYATDISDDDLATARNLVGDNLAQSGDVRGYIFGDHFADQWHFEKIGMPPFGGYAVGYRAVQAYLQRTGKTVEEATFILASEIAAESGYFG